MTTLHNAVFLLGAVFLPNTAFWRNQDVICLGIAFDGKQILVKERKEQAA